MCIRDSVHAADVLGRVDEYAEREAAQSDPLSESPLRSEKRSRQRPSREARPTATSATVQAAIAGLHSKGTAYSLEIMPAFFGIYGLGWLYVGKTRIGGILLALSVGYLALTCLLIVLTGGSSMLVTSPLGWVFIGISVLQLNDYILDHPDQFV
ncbi:MAG: hypothetical protein GYB68_17980 [Chloroflexi bacterium]|nr:hypothetical protein [Chloroflexota bacterium]